MENALPVLPGVYAVREEVNARNQRTHLEKIKMPEEEGYIYKRDGDIVRYLNLEGFPEGVEKYREMEGKIDGEHYIYGSIRWYSIKDIHDRPIKSIPYFLIERVGSPVGEYYIKEINPDVIIEKLPNPPVSQTGGKRRSRMRRSRRRRHSSHRRRKVRSTRRH